MNELIGSRPPQTVAAGELLSEAQSLSSQSETTRLLDWHAHRSRGPGSVAEAVLQLRDGTGRRWQLLVPDADELPSLSRIWPAVAWPQREAVERLGLRFTGAEIPTPLWTAAVRAAHDEEDGAEEPGEPDGFLPLGDPGATTPYRLDLRVRLKRRIIEAAQALPGKTHSDFESLATRQGYAQLPPLAEGLNEQAPFAVGLAAILAAEALLCVTPSGRCRRVRMLLAEASRIGAHCAWLATQLLADKGAWGEALAVREAVAALLADISGSRWATGVHRIGGIHADVTDNSPALLAALAIAVEGLCVTARRHTIDNRKWRRRFIGSAAIDAETAQRWALTGPVLRAAGVEFDVRRDAPYLDYDEIDFAIPTGSNGDVADRVAVRLAEMSQSIAICRQCLDNLPAGVLCQQSSTPLAAAEMIEHFEVWMDGHGHRPSAGTMYLPTESADGELAFWLAADGTGKPAAVHLRSPSLYNFQLLEHLLPGTGWDFAPDVVASMNIVAPEMDR